MGIGPAFAVRQMLEKNSLSVDQIDLVEVCECLICWWVGMGIEIYITGCENQPTLICYIIPTVLLCVFIGERSFCSTVYCSGERTWLG